MDSASGVINVKYQWCCSSSSRLGGLTGRLTGKLASWLASWLASCCWSPAKGRAGWLSAAAASLAAAFAALAVASLATAAAFASTFVARRQVECPAIPDVAASLAEQGEAVVAATAGGATAHPAKAMLRHHAAVVIVQASAGACEAHEDSGVASTPALPAMPSAFLEVIGNCCGLP